MAHTQSKSKSPPFSLAVSECRVYVPLRVSTVLCATLTCVLDRDALLLQPAVSAVSSETEVDHRQKILFHAHWITNAQAPFAKCLR